jgi:predicted nucleic-acid-binding protein
MLAIDTNLIVRFLTLDEPTQAKRALEIVTGEDVFVSITALLEAEWVLRDAYEMPRDEVVRELKRFCSMERVTVGGAYAVSRAFHLFEAGMDFADALHLSQDEGCEAFVTFDKRLERKARGLDGVAVRLA